MSGWPSSTGVVAPPLSMTLAYFLFLLLHPQYDCCSQGCELAIVTPAIKFIFQAAEWKGREGQRYDFLGSEFPVKNFATFAYYLKEIWEIEVSSRIFQESFIIWGYIYSISLANQIAVALAVVFSYRSGQSRLHGLQNQTSLGLDSGLLLTLGCPWASLGTSLRLNFILCQMEIIIESTV